jgi:hypothetical protein
MIKEWKEGKEGGLVNGWMDRRTDRKTKNKKVKWDAIEKIQGKDGGHLSKGRQSQEEFLGRCVYPPLRIHSQDKHESGHIT